MATIPETSARVPANTAEKVNRQIEAEALERIERYAKEPVELTARLDLSIGDGTSNACSSSMRLSWR